MKIKFKKLFKLLIIPVMMCVITLSLVSCGTTTGKSAYEIACDNGFVGTEEEWLASLKGTDGTNGSDGADGKDGEDSTETISSIYDAAVSNGYTGTFLEFVKEYLSDDDLLSYSMNYSLLSSVSITSTFTITTSSMFGGTQTSTSTSSGSGVIYEINKESGSAYIITNYHVVYSNYQTSNNGISTNISCYIYGYESSDYAISATYIGGTITYDLAVLKIEGSDLLKSSSCQAVTISSDDLYDGQTVFATGNNQGKGLSTNSGKISQTYESSKYTIGNTTVSMYLIRHDVAINEGNSGGGLFNESGELIGIVNCKKESTGVEGMCYAIPYNIVSTIVEKAINNYTTNGTTTLTRCLLGVTYSESANGIYYDETTATYHEQNKITIKTLTTGTDADGILAVGDIVTSITLNNKTYEIKNGNDFLCAILAANVGDTVTLAITRDGVSQTVNVTFTSSSTLS